MTLRGVLNQPLEEEPSKLEKQAAIKVMSRILHQNESTTCTLSTGERVRIRMNTEIQKHAFIFKHCFTQPISLMDVKTSVTLSSVSSKHTIRDIKGSAGSKCRRCFIIHVRWWMR